MHSTFHSSLFPLFPSFPAFSQLVVEGTQSGQHHPFRVGTISRSRQGTNVCIMCYGNRKAKVLAKFSAANVDHAVALVYSHASMRGLEMRTVY